MKFLFVALLFVVVCHGFGHERHFPEGDHAPKAPSSWELLNAPIKQERMRVVVTLQRSNMDEMFRIANDVSDPRSPHYGRHLSREQVKALIEPSAAAQQRVVDWLSANGVHSVEWSHMRDRVFCDLSVQQAEHMFQVTINAYGNEKLGRIMFRTVQPYSIPAYLKGDVAVVTGLQHFRISESSMIPFNPNVDNIPVFPKDLRERYTVTGINNSTKNLQGVAEFQSQWYKPSDLSSFVSKYAPWTNLGTIAKTIGQNNDGGGSAEAALDTEYIMTVTGGVTTWLYTTAQFDFWTDLTSWVSEINKETTPPYVLSVSYGDQSYGNEPSATYQKTLNQDFMTIAARGVSIIFSSGDSGAGCNVGACDHLQPNFPATCPWVTSVGATRFLNRKVGEEGATEFFGSGGGFSYVFDRSTDAPWQDDAVAGWVALNDKIPPNSFYNKEGRATPDVSALGANFQIEIEGSITGVYGTSASAPTFAAVISKLNGLRLAAGKSPMGFLNHWIYQTYKTNPEAWNDVTTGNNNLNSCCGQGFYCTKGWDPVTGVGTPDTTALEKLI